MPYIRLSLRQLLAKTDGKFIVPAYQRRYVWGHPADGDSDPAAFLARGLAEAVLSGEPLFVNGITLLPRKGGYEVVDGQQRIIFFRLLMLAMGIKSPAFSVRFDLRPDAQAWMKQADKQGAAPGMEPKSQDTHLFQTSLSLIRQAFAQARVPMNRATGQALLDLAWVLCVEVEKPGVALAAFRMMNGTKSPMAAADIIKADIMRHASDPDMNSYGEQSALRARFASEWESWSNWWNRTDVSEYYADCLEAGEPHISLLLKLCLRSSGADMSARLRYDELWTGGEKPSPAAAKALFRRLRHTQKLFEDSMTDPERYNRIKAILLLQDAASRSAFLRMYFVDKAIGQHELVRYYKLSFLGMTVAEIAEGMPPDGKFYELLSSLSMADVYNSEAKRDAYNLLLRLNIDEDIKLGRRFDFSIWTNRSLEHIYSKSKVWHIDEHGHIRDGNGGELRVPRSKLEGDSSYLCRDKIANYDGMPLSEHCIGNLVLLYGDNNAVFGNSGFESKKMQFLTPGGVGVFQSRNLLHSVCVFALGEWTAKSIVDNYNLTLKNLKLYYGYK